MDQDAFGRVLEEARDRVAPLVPDVATDDLMRILRCLLAPPDVPRRFFIRQPTTGDFTLRVLGSQIWDSSSDNVDVEVRFADGARYGATFFALRNVEKLFEKNRRTGECAAGLYLWAANLILVENLSMEVMERTVSDLLKNEEFAAAFARLDD